VVVDHFHAIKLANTVVDQVRRRTQQAFLGHRGRKHDPLYRIRKLLITAAEQLTEHGWARLRAGLTAGDPTGEVSAAWQGKELLRAVYAAGDLATARAALDRLDRWCDGVQLLELTRLARTVRAWQTEILAWHLTAGCSNGPTEANNLLVKKVKRVGMASALRQLPAAVAAALRRQVADAPHRKTARPLTTFRGVEPVIGSLSAKVCAHFRAMCWCPAGVVAAPVEAPVDHPAGCSGGPAGTLLPPAGVAPATEGAGSCGRGNILCSSASAGSPGSIPHHRRVARDCAGSRPSAS
jgi:Transposase